ncbi:F-box only protein 9 [Hypsizygus marmoreus]|uniref:F-box only protein 9 n=1 Tax=Hypsizygus marmoreus TaxID=39966 RepID=A0A369JFA3_HYPMA|nr:F-box only protein 9 [Hypsizygus marmoreus]
MQPAPAIPPPEDEPQELARFRQEWLAELRRKAGPSTVSGKTDELASTSDVRGPTSIPAKYPVIPSTLPQVHSGPSSQTIAGIPPAVAKLSASSIEHASVPLSKHLRSALDVYRRAVEHEQRSELDEALALYRQAFRMDAHIDRVYQREEMLSSIRAAQAEPLQKTKSFAREEAIADELTTKARSWVLKAPGTRETVTVTGTIASLLAGFPPNLSFEPEIEEEPVHLQKLPDELLVMILRKLDPTTIERFASVSRKARVVSLDSTLWRNFVQMTYKPPQVPNSESMSLVVERCLSNYRRVFVEHPRIRLDGVYIAICQYVRHGLSENHWVNISHLVTYHRYLRFFPNGQVLSLLVNEDYTHQQIIPLLKPTLRMKGFFIGNWHLSGKTVQLTNLLDASGRFPLPSSDAPVSPESNDGAPYAFAMTLSLLSRPTGRWNRLDIKSYNSVKLETGEVNPIQMKNEHEFWFSKVRSYALY